MADKDKGYISKNWLIGVLVTLLLSMAGLYAKERVDRDSKRSDQISSLRESVASIRTDVANIKEDVSDIKSDLKDLRNKK